MSFQKDLNMSLLLDIYGELLTPKQIDYLDYYYNEDMSLAEIAEHIKITRQGVYDSIKKSEKILLELEAKLGLAKKLNKISALADEIENNANEILNKNLEKAFSSEIEKKAENIILNIKQIKKL